MKGVNCALNSAVVAVALNLVLPLVVVKVLKLSGGKGLIGEMLNMLEHHHRTPVSSSVIVAAIVFLSVLIGSCVKLF